TKITEKAPKVNISESVSWNAKPRGQQGIRPFFKIQSKPDTEKIVQHRPIDFAFHRRQPREIEFRRRDPSRRAEFRLRGPHVDSGLRRGQVGEEINLLDALASVFRKARRKQVSIRAFAGDDLVAARFERHLFAQLARQRLLARLAFVHAALWE